MSATLQHTDVVVVGAGPVGVLNALGLAQAGLSVTLLEAAESVLPLPRAMVYHWSVLEGIERLGLLDAAKAAGFTKQDYAYRVHATGEMIELDLKVLEGLVPHPYNLHMGQHKLAELALEALSGLDGASVRFGTTLAALAQDDDGVTVTVETAGGTEQLRASYLVGADGASSPVRKALGLTFDGMTWPEIFVATNVYYDFQKHGYARSVLQLDDTYGAVIAKIDDEDLWRVTYCERPGVQPEEAGARIPEWFATLLPGGDEHRLRDFRPYRMHQRAASSMRAGRVVLAGDAAHATNPTGGLGLTSGLFDTFVLYDALAAVVKGTTDDSVLDQYSDERRRTFLEIASPRASANKKMIYHVSDPVEKEQQVARLRALAADEDKQREVFHFTKQLETPPLVPVSAR